MAGGRNQTSTHQVPPILPPSRHQTRSTIAASIRLHLPAYIPTSRRPMEPPAHTHMHGLGTAHGATAEKQRPRRPHKQKVPNAAQPAMPATGPAALLPSKRRRCTAVPPNAADVRLLQARRSTRERRLGCSAPARALCNAAVCKGGSRACLQQAAPKLAIHLARATDRARMH